MEFQQKTKHILAFIRLGRPLFLGGGVALHLLGVTQAVYSGVSLNIPLLILGQLVISSIQLMTHYSNEYFDLEADRANHTATRWSGGSRVLVDGLLPRRTAITAALVLLMVAIIIALVLVRIEPAPLTLPLLLLAMALAWAYSAPPFRLYSRGIGEMSAAFLVAGLTPMVGFYLQSGKVDVLPLLASIPLLCLQFNMLLAVEFPDAEGDAIAGKRNLVVRLGRECAAKLYLCVLVLAYGMLIPLYFCGLPPLVVLAVIMTVPLALFLAWRVKQGDWGNPAYWGRLAFGSLYLVMCAAVAQMVAFTLLAVGQ